MSRSKAWGFPCLGAFLLSVNACSDREVQRSSPSLDPLASASQGQSNADGPSILSALRVRHQYHYHLHQPVALAGPSASTAFGLNAPRSALATGPARHFVRKSTGIAPYFLRPSAADIELPQAANGSFRVLDKASAVNVEARLLHARNVQAILSDGLVIYPQASAQGGTVIQRPTEIGTEDYIEFAERPEHAEVSYEFRMLSGVAGLRLVGSSLEFIDATGSPSLRVATPSLVTAQGERAEARLEVEGCAVDRDARAPWERPPVAPGADKCTLTLSWDDARVTYPALLDPAWVTTGALATARSGASSVVLSNGRVLVVGGVAADQWSCLDSAELYNPSTRTFAATGSLATGRCRQAAVRRASGQALIAGGADSNGTLLASTEIYDMTKGVWTSGAALSDARADHQAVLLNTGDVLVAGGTTDVSEKLSSSTSTWNSAGRLIAPATAHTLTVLSDGRVLLLGGSQPQLYVPSSNNWYPAPSPLAANHEGHSATRLSNGQVLVVGEQSPTTEIFDSRSNVWSRTGTASTARRGHSATLLSDGRVVLAGGLDAASPTYLSSEVYDPAWGTLNAGPGLATPRRDHIAALLSSGRVMIAGGLDSNYTTLSSAEEFDPAALGTVISEYKLTAKIDTEVLSDRMTELWASVTRPNALANGKRYPLLVFLHGNHATCGYGSNPRHDYSCEYTDSGTCPQGYVVTPNHRGYDYITTALAARGYVVVSINANRGINCGGGTSDDGGLNLARGRLVLRHLEQLSAWNRGTATPPASLGFSPANRLDFSQVGLFGHSRGGEGVRAAYQQYRDTGSAWPSRIVDPVTFRAIFEIGPVDGQTSRVLNAEGTRWNVLLPMCDGDVSDLEGVRPFDRMISTYSPPNAAVTSTYTIWGANHNFYNTEWQESDSGGCTDHRALFSVDSRVIGSAEQRQTGLRSVSEFFLANVGAAALPSLADLFNPEQAIEFDSRIERGYGSGQTISMTRQLEDFTQQAGYSTFNVQNVHGRVTVTHGTLDEHDAALHAATIRWTIGGSSTYFQTNFAAAGSGFDISNYGLLDFRIGRARDMLNVQPSTQVSVQLVNADNSLSTPVSASDFSDDIIGPVAGPYGNYHQMLTTIRIPLGSFGSVNLKSIRGVRFTFSDTPTGSIYLANVRATRSTLVGTGSVSTMSPAARMSAVTSTRSASVNVSNAVTPGTRANVLARQVTTGNQVVSLKSATSGTAVEITLASSTPFSVRNDLLMLSVGGGRSSLSQHPKGDLKHVVFVVEQSVFDAAQSGDRLTVHYQRGTGDSWDFGVLDKTRLDK